MLTKDERQKLIDQLRDFPLELKKTIDQITDSKIDSPYGKDKWTGRQVVHHLVDSHLNGYLRVRWALTENNPTVKSYDQDEFAVLPDYEMELDSSLQILQALHKKWAYMFDNLTDKQWKNSLNHPDPDYSNIEELLIAYVKHGEKHIGHIKRLM